MRTQQIALPEHMTLSAFKSWIVDGLEPAALGKRPRSDLLKKIALVQQSRNPMIRRSSAQAIFELLDDECATFTISKDPSAKSSVDLSRVGALVHYVYEAHKIDDFTRRELAALDDTLFDADRALARVARTAQTSSADPYAVRRSLLLLMSKLEAGDVDDWQEVLERPSPNQSPEDLIKIAISALAPRGGATGASDELMCSLITQWLMLEDVRQDGWETLPTKLQLMCCTPPLHTRRVQDRLRSWFHMSRQRLPRTFPQERLTYSLNHMGDAAKMFPRTRR